MTDPAEPAPRPAPSVDRRARGESLERGTGLDVAALLARTGAAGGTSPVDSRAGAVDATADALRRSSVPGTARTPSESSSATQSVVSESDPSMASPDVRTWSASPGATGRTAAVDAERSSASTGSGVATTSAGSLARAASDSDVRSGSPGAGAVPDPSSDPRADPTSLTAAITALANRFGATALDADTDFFDAGGTSLAAVEFVAALAGELDVHLDLDTVFFDARPRRLARAWLASRAATGVGGALAAGGALGADAALGTSGAVGTGERPGTGGRTWTGAGARGGIGGGIEASAVGEIAVGGTGSGADGASGVPTGTGGVTSTGDGNRTGDVMATTARAGKLDSGDTDDLAQLFADLSGADRLPLVAPAQRSAPRRILLTGATGFLGSHLLLDLLRHSDAHVVCLIRAEDDGAARQRLIEALRRFALPSSREVLRRVTPMAGDLREARLGLSDEQWESAAAQVDSIVNAAAAVDFLRGYPSLRRTNVLGPLTLAELACTGRSKPIHHISSLAVFNGVQSDSLAEDDPTAPVATLPIGYDRSKWAAEAILRRAADRGLTVTVLRPGGIGTHPESGAHNPRDLNSGITAALLRFRTVPGFRYLNGAPVDWVSRMAAEIVTRPSAWGHTYHLTGAPTSLDQIVARTTLGGLGVRVQHWESWCDEVVRAIREEPVPELESLAQVLQSPVARRQLAAMVAVPPSRADRTDAFVAAHGLPAPVSGAAAGTRMLAATAGLESPSGEPYLRFDETLSGLVGPVGDGAEIPCDLRLTLSIANSAQAFTARVLDVDGELRCPAVHDEPLTVTGTAAVRPHDGLPLRNESRHPIMRYDLTLRAADGRTWWLTGHKFAAARRRFVRQLGTQAIEIGPPGEPASWSGEIAVPMHTYLSDQIDGIRVDPRLPERQQRLAKLLWLSWFGGQLGVSLMEPMLRVGVDLLDLRRALREERRR